MNLERGVFKMFILENTIGPTTLRLLKVSQGRWYVSKHPLFQ